MATFAIKGFNVGGPEDSAAQSEIRFVAAPSEETARFSYDDTSGEPFRVVLDDYNVMVDDAHLTDLPDGIWVEVFGVDGADGAAGDMTQVLTLNSAAEGIVKYFNLGPGALPQSALEVFTDPAQTFHISTHGRQGEFSLSGLPDVEISGVFHPNSHPATVAEDHFDFYPAQDMGGMASDVVDIELAQVAALDAQPGSEADTLVFDWDSDTEASTTEINSDDWH